VLITADHGNAEKMLGTAAPGDKAQPHTAHTNNPVPLIYIGRQAKAAGSGALSDIAPTMLALMHLKQPQEMTGRSLFKLLESTQHAA
jgi:2,3-bisphosphoglycerate-independent phosphoglycerate mutase